MSTVRIDEDGEQRLRRLQDAWTRLQGERPTEEQLLARGLAYLEENKEVFIAEAGGGWQPLSEEEIEQVEARSRDMGDWSARDIDETIYG